MKVPRKKIFKVPRNKANCKVPTNKTNCNVPTNKTNCKVPTNKTNCKVPTNKPNCKLPINKPRKVKVPRYKQTTKLNGAQSQTDLKVSKNAETNVEMPRTTK